MIAELHDGREIFYTTTGAGPELLIVHGAASDADTMAPLAAELAGKYRCTTLDRLGYRRSSQIAAHTTLQEQAQAIDAVRRASVGGPAWICGHSVGGSLAAGYAALFPESVRGLVLLEPPMYGLFDPAMRPSEVRTIEEEVIPLFAADDISEAIKRFIAHLEVSQETWSTLARGGHGKNGDENWLRFRYEVKLAQRWPRSRSDLRSITQPVLVLAGDRTTGILQSVARMLVAALPQARLEILPDSDHLAAIANPGLVAEKISRFLDRELGR